MKSINTTGQLGRPLGITALLGAAMVLSGNSALASLTYQTGPGATDSNGSVDASAIITLGNGTVTVTLTDLLQNPVSSGQTLSGINFNISGASGSATLATATGYTTSIMSGGSYTPSATAGNLAHWGATTSNLSTIGIVGMMPYDLIVGPDNLGGFSGTSVSGGKYSAANNGFGNFNPYVLGSATFTIDISGVTSNSTLSEVNFEFGTQPETVPGVPTTYSPVPEPGVAGVLVGCLNLLPLGACLVRRLNNKQTPKS